MQGRIQFEFDTAMVPPYGKIVYDYTNPMWIPNEIKNAQSNCMKGPRKQNRIDILDWTFKIKEASLVLNLDTEEISYMGTKLPCDLRKGECLPTPFTKATIVWESETHCQLFELIRFDAFMVKYQNRYWIETNAEWTTVQQYDITQKIKKKQNRNYCHQIRSLPISRTRMRFTPNNTQNCVRRHLHNIRIRIRCAHRTKSNKKERQMLISNKDLKTLLFK